MYIHKRVRARYTHDCLCNRLAIDIITIFSTLIVEESFDTYVEVELLDGDNKYDAGDHGFQVILL